MQEMTRRWCRVLASIIPQEPPMTHRNWWDFRWDRSAPVTGGFLRIAHNAGRHSGSMNHQERGLRKRPNSSLPRMCQWAPLASPAYGASRSGCPCSGKAGNCDDRACLSRDSHAAQCAAANTEHKWFRCCRKHSDPRRSDRRPCASCVCRSCRSTRVRSSLRAVGDSAHQRSGRSSKASRPKIVRAA
jgi:hypothetical protein